MKNFKIEQPHHPSTRAARMGVLIIVVIIEIFIFNIVFSGYITTAKQPPPPGNSHPSLLAPLNSTAAITLYLPIVMVAGSSSWWQPTVGTTWQWQLSNLYLLPISQVCSLTRYQVSAISCNLCQPRQITVMPGSPSRLRPRKPPNWAIQRTVCRTVGGADGNEVVRWMRI